MTKIFTLKFVWLTFFILSAFLVGFYIFQVGALSQEKYLIKDYEEKMNLLSKNNIFLDISFSKMNSLSNIENYLKDKNFVKTNGVKYIRILEGSVVAK